MEETEVEEKEVHMRLVPLIRIGDQLITSMIVLGVIYYEFQIWVCNQGAIRLLYLIFYEFCKFEIFELFLSSNINSFVFYTLMILYFNMML